MKPLFFTPVMALLLLAAAPAHAASDADVTIIKAENVVIGGNMIVSVTGFGYFYPKRY